MSGIVLLRVVVIVLAIPLLAADPLVPSRYRRPGLVARAVLALFAVISALFMVFLFVNHINFPFHLEIMEGLVLQQFERASNLHVIYPEPSPQYVPLAYNPLYYVVSIPAGWIFGVNLFTLRLMSIIAMIGTAALLFKIVWDKTHSLWWATIVVGLFAAAYRVMDSYLDTAHSDSWLLFSAVLGSYIIDRKRTRPWNILGVVILVAAFWFKQHGALFCVGGVLFLTWREVQNTSWRQGLQRSVPYWLTAVILGPVLYVLAGPALFGPKFHYFTWEVPSQWSTLNFDTLYRYGTFILKHYLVLSIAGGLFFLWVALREREKLDIWQVQFVFAALSGFLGALDRWSSDNVFIPMGTWFILMGCLALYTLSQRPALTRRVPVHLFALFVTVSLLLYDPRSELVARDASEKYDELVATLEQLDAGSIYAPWQSQLPNGPELYPTVHWVALEDMIRGRGQHDKDNSPVSRQLLDPVMHPKGNAYILTNETLDYFSWLSFLNNYYSLETDFGDRFKDLKDPPRRFDNQYPRYLYRYDPAKAAQNVAEGP